MTAADTLPREERLRSFGPTALAMVKWRGWSEATYAAAIHLLDPHDLADRGDCVVVFVERKNGHAINHGVAPCSPGAARSLAARYAKRGANEMHLIHADSAAERAEIVSDLQP